MYVSNATPPSKGEQVCLDILQIQEVLHRSMHMIEKASVVDLQKITATLSYARCGFSVPICR